MPNPKNTEKDLVLQEPVIPRPLKLAGIISEAKPSHCQGQRNFTGPRHLKGYQLESSFSIRVEMEQDKSSEGPKEFTELDWISLKNDLGTAQMKTVETSSSKFYRKFNENPFVPIGCGLTTLALCYGLYSFSTGKRGTSQNMMRLRVVAQGFTVAALMLGIAKTSMS